MELTWRVIGFLLNHIGTHTFILLNEVSIFNYMIFCFCISFVVFNRTQNYVRAHVHLFSLKGFSLKSGCVCRFWQYMWGPNIAKFHTNIKIPINCSCILNAVAYGTPRTPSCVLWPHPLDGPLRKFIYALVYIILVRVNEYSEAPGRTVMFGGSISSIITKSCL